MRNKFLALFVGLAASAALAVDFNVNSSSGAIPGVVSKAYVHHDGTAYFTISSPGNMIITRTGSKIALDGMLWRIGNINSTVTTGSWAGPYVRAVYPTVVAALEGGLPVLVVYNTSNGESSCGTDNICTFAHFHILRP